MTVSQMFDFDWGSAVDPALEELIALPQTQKLDLRGPTSDEKPVSY